METIFHEKQCGSLCAQHCLNALLQSEYFTAVDLASLAQQIDDDERMKMLEGEGGEHTDQYRQFIQTPSDNMDDSGFFSIQVIASALKVWSLDLIPFNSKNEIAIFAKQNPTLQKAYICNYREHWFTIRKIGQQWFNLNSLLTGPELISDTYLSLFLMQLQQEGYSIFIVNGILPNCSADNALSSIRVVQIEKPLLLSEVDKSKNKSIDTSRELNNEKQAYSLEEEKQLQEVIKLSIESNADAEKRQLDAVLALSLEQQTTHSMQSTQPMQTSQQSNYSYLTEEEMLDAALKMSLEALH